MLKWRDHDRDSHVFVGLPGGNMHHLTVSGPGQYCEVWTAEASLLNADYRQLKYSGLLNGGSTRDMAKEAALVALKKIT